MPPNKIPQLRRGTSSPNQAAFEAGEGFCRWEADPRILGDRERTQPGRPEYWRLGVGAKTARDKLLITALRALAERRRVGSHLFDCGFGRSKVAPGSRTIQFHRLDKRFLAKNLSDSLPVEWRKFAVHNFRTPFA